MTFDTPNTCSSFFEGAKEYTYGENPGHKDNASRVTTLSPLIDLINSYRQEDFITNRELTLSLIVFKAHRDSSERNAKEAMIAARIGVEAKPVDTFFGFSESEMSAICTVAEQAIQNEKSGAFIRNEKKTPLSSLAPDAVRDLLNTIEDSVTGNTPSSQTAQSHQSAEALTLQG